MSEADRERELEELNSALTEEFAPVIIYVAIVVLFGLVGNTMSVIFYGFNSPRTPTNCIITSLAVADLFCCVVLLDVILELCYAVTFRSVIGCKVKYFINHTFFSIAFTTLFLVAIDRFRKLCFPFGWQFTIFRVKIAFAVICSYSIAISLRGLIVLDVVRVNVTNSKEEVVEGFFCTLSNKEELQGVIAVFQIADLLTWLVIVCGSIALYSLIALRLWSTRNKVLTEHCKPRDHSIKFKKETLCDSFAVFDKTSFPKSTDTGQSDKNKVGSEKSMIKNGEVGESPHVKGAENVLSSVSKEKSFEDIVDLKQGDRARENKNNLKNLKKAPKTILKSKILTTKMEAEQKIALMMLVVTSVSVISFVPYFVVYIGINKLSEFSDQKSSVGIEIASRSYILNNVVNPYIIGLFNSKFRVFVKSKFCGRCMTNTD